LSVLPRGATTVLVGGFGTGKTEIAIALSRQAAAEGERVWLVDLDIVTPYFRPRDISADLAREGVTVVAPAGEWAVSEMPAVGGDVGPVIAGGARGEATVVVDLGGEASGTRVMGSLAAALDGGSVNVVHVLNRSRAAYSGHGLCDTIRSIEQSSGLGTTHVASNTHLGRASTEQVVVDGARWARALSDALGLPLFLAASRPEFTSAVADAVGRDVPILPIEPALRLPWDD